MVFDSCAASLLCVQVFALGLWLTRVDVDRCESSIIGPLGLPASIGADGCRMLVLIGRCRSGIAGGAVVLLGSK